MSAYRYPHLTQWKHLGLHVLPKGLPGLLLSSEYLEDYNFQRNIIEGQRHLEDLSFEEKEHLKAHPLAPGIDSFSSNLLTNYAESQVSRRERELGRKVILAQERVLSGEPREQVLNDFGAANLPETRGGHFSLSNAQLTFLRHSYNELRACIKEARSANCIPLKKTPNWNRFGNINLSIACPWLNDLFEPNELCLLVIYPQISKCAQEILSKRLRFIASRTLKDLLTSRSK